MLNVAIQYIAELYKAAKTAKYILYVLKLLSDIFG